MRAAEDEEDEDWDRGLAVEVTSVSPPGREAEEVPEVLEVPVLTSLREAEVLVRLLARSTPGTPSARRRLRRLTRGSPGTTKTPSRTPATGATISQVETLSPIGKYPGQSPTVCSVTGPCHPSLESCQYTYGRSVVEFSAAEDWDNDEYTGSLSDTKVFTPSGSSAKAVGEPVNGSVGHAAPGGNYRAYHCNQSFQPNTV